MNCQRNWLYLESIFSAPDIQRQLPAEARMFMQVDKSYKDIMRKVNRVPLAIRAATQPGKDTNDNGLYYCMTLKSVLLLTLLWFHQFSLNNMDFIA